MELTKKIRHRINVSKTVEIYSNSLLIVKKKLDKLDAIFLTKPKNNWDIRDLDRRKQVPQILAQRFVSKIIL